MHLFYSNPSDDDLWELSCKQLCDNIGFEKVIAFLKEEQSMILKQKKNFIVYTDYYKKMDFLLTYEHYKINKGLIKDSSKLDETDCVLCFTAITCLSNPIIYCSNCERGAHRVCLRLESVPNEDFYCVTCLDEINKKSKKKEKDITKCLYPNSKIKNWMENSEGRPFNSMKFRGELNENSQQLIVDRSLLTMKNKNSASRTEDINRVLSSKLEIRFEGKLHGISKKWVKIEVPIKVVLSMIYSLIKNNFNKKRFFKCGIVLDLIQNRLYVNNLKKLENQVILDKNETYNLEDWVYSSKYCIVSKTQTRLQYLNKNDRSIENWEEKLTNGMVMVNEKGVNGLSKLDKIREENVKEIMLKGLSKQITNKDSFEDFEVFRCENMMILKKFLENEKNLGKCIKGDEWWIKKINKEISYEIRRIVYMLQDCRSQLKINQNITQLTCSDANLKLLENLEKTSPIMTPQFSENNLFRRPKKRKAGLKKNKLENFKRPRGSKKNSDYMCTDKLKTECSKEFVIQDIKLSKYISQKGYITDDIRHYKGLSIFSSRNPKLYQVELTQKFNYEISIVILKEKNKGGFRNEISKMMNSNVNQTERYIKNSLKNKSIDINPSVNKESKMLYPLPSQDCCYFCNKSDFMLIEFNSKKIHLICLIFSGNLLDFFESPKCKVSTFLMFLQLIKYNLLNFLQKGNWKETMERLKIKYKIKKNKINSISVEIKKLLLEFENLRKEIINLGVIIFKKNIINKFCRLCYKQIGKFYSQ